MYSTVEKFITEVNLATIKGGEHFFMVKNY